MHTNEYSSMHPFYPYLIEIILSQQSDCYHEAYMRKPSNVKVKE